MSTNTITNSNTSNKYVYPTSSSTSSDSSQCMIVWSYEPTPSYITIKTVVGGVEERQGVVSFPSFDHTVYNSLHPTYIFIYTTKDNMSSSNNLYLYIYIYIYNNQQSISSPLINELLLWVIE